MAHVEPRERAALEAEQPGLGAVFGGVEAAMGFVPNSMLTMAHMPQLTLAFSSLANVVFGGDLKAQLQAFAELAPEQQHAEQNLPPDLVQLIAFASSVASGCRYCQAHTSHSMVKRGGQEAKLDDILQFESSERFSPAERAAVALALAAGAVPNEAAPGHFAALREHFNERQIVQIVAVIAMFGFLNRWNDTMATALEADPVEFAGAHLQAVDWAIGKHAGSTEGAA